MIRLVLMLSLLAGSAAADGLMGRDVSWGTLAYDDPEAPIFVGQRHGAVVSDAIEYGLGPEGPQNGWDIVPTVIDIRDRQVIISYPDMPEGAFPVLEFNGHVLDFLTECVLFSGAEQNLELSTQTLSEDAIYTDRGQLFIDMGGVTYGADTFIVIDLDVTDCPLS